MDSCLHAAQLLDVNGESKIVLIPIVVAESSQSPSLPNIYILYHGYIYSTILRLKTKYVIRKNGVWRMVLQLYIPRAEHLFSSCKCQLNNSVILFIPWISWKSCWCSPVSTLYVFFI
jgi:hypothetical protein